MSFIFNLLLIQPLTNALVFLYSNVTLGDLGLAIILLTILIRFILYPIFYRQLKSQALMQKVQPEIAKAQEQHKGNKEAQATAVMDVYKKNKVNPFGTFFYLIIQLPILWAVFHIFNAGFSEAALSQLYSFVHAPTEINTMFLGLLDLAKPNMIIVVLTAGAQYIQSRLSLPRQKPGEAPSKAAAMGKYMVYLGPGLTLLIFAKFSAALGLYWLTSSVFSIFQQRIINKKLYGTATR